MYKFVQGFVQETVYNRTYKSMRRHTKIGKPKRKKHLACKRNIKNPLYIKGLWFGAGGGTRTHTMSPSTDFESVTSAYSITPAYICCPGGQQTYCIILFRKSQVLPENFFAEGLYFSESGLYSIRSAMPQPKASQNFSSR